MDYNVISEAPSRVRKTKYFIIFESEVGLEGRGCIISPICDTASGNESHSPKIVNGMQ